MAIDSRVKRQSAAGIKPFKKVILPDGTLSAADRVQIACLYCGITIDAIRILIIVSSLITDLTITKMKSTDLTIVSILTADLAIASLVTRDLTVESALSTDLHITSILEVH